MPPRMRCHCIPSAALSQKLSQDLSQKSVLRSDPLSAYAGVILNVRRDLCHVEVSQKLSQNRLDVQTPA